MLNDKRIAKYIIGKNEKGIYLTIGDLYSLLFLYEQRLLTVSQMYKFYSFFYNQPKNFNAFRNRLNKMAKLKIIRKENYALKKKNGFELGMITISDKGVFILEQCGFIPKNQNYTFVSKRQFEHTLGIREVVLNSIELEVNRKGWILAGPTGEHTYMFSKLISKYGIDNLSPFNKWSAIPKHIYDDEDWGDNILETSEINTDHNIFKENTLYSIPPFKLIHDIEGADSDLKPDWIFRYNNHYFNIEVDTGTERGGVIESKVKRYIKLAHLMPSIQHHVIFALVDDSYQTVYEHGRKKARTQNLKEQIRRIPEFSTSKVNVVIVPIKRIQNVMFQLLQQTQNTQFNGKYFETLVKRMNNSFAFSYNGVPLNTPELLKQFGFYHKGLLNIDLPIFKFEKKDIKNARGVLEFNAIIIKMHEGSVRSAHMLIQLSNLLKRSENDNGRLVIPRNTKIFAIYNNEYLPDESSILHDTLHSAISEKHVILMRETDINQFNPQFYCVKKRGVKPFEDFFKA